MATKKTDIKDYKDRMSSPIGAIRIDKNGKPIKKVVKANKRKGK